jgi:hypothetical protein
MIQRCIRCGAPAGIVMAFDYDARQAWLDDLTEPVIPGSGYALCERHADRFTPPVRPLFASLEVA